MTKFSFYLSDKDTERLLAIKEIQGKNDLTANDFARLLLENELFKLFPATPKFDDNGELVNKERYKG